MKSFQEYIQYRINTDAKNYELLGLNADLRKLTLMHKYFEYCLSHPDSSDETDTDKNIIIPLSTFLTQYAILCNYYELLIQCQSTDNVLPVKTIPNQEDYPLKASDVQTSYDVLNKQIIDNVRRVAAQFKFENHSTGGRVVTNPQRAPHYLLASIALIASSAGLIELAHQLYLIPHFMPVFSVTAIALVSALIAFTGAALLIRHGLERYRTVPHADELAEKFDLKDETAPKKKYDHVYYAHDYNNPKSVSEKLFHEKQLAMHQLIDRATQASDPAHPESVDLLNEKITHNVLLTHYRRIYDDFAKYSKGWGLLDTGATDHYPHATSEADRKLFCSTFFEPKVNLTQLKQDNMNLKATMLTPSRHS